MRWRTAGNRRRKRHPRNAIIVTVWRADGTVASHDTHLGPNALTRAIRWDRAFAEAERRYWPTR
jgi:hypothetical protein